MGLAVTNFFLRSAHHVLINPHRNQCYSLSRSEGSTSKSNLQGPGLTMRRGPRAGPSPCPSAGPVPSPGPPARVQPSRGGGSQPQAPSGSGTIIAEGARHPAPSGPQATQVGAGFLRLQPRETPAATALQRLREAPRLLQAWARASGPL